MYMVDPEEYTSNRPTAYSHVYLEYEPSTELNKSLLQFIQPELRVQSRFAQIALYGESYLKAPIESGQGELMHPPALAKHLSAYERSLKSMSSHQLRLASFVDMQMHRDKSLNIHFEVLPNELERRLLGQLALKDWARDKSTIGVVAHIPADALNDPYGEASAKLRSLLAMSHPSVQSRQRTTPAPLSSQLWVQQPILRDKYPTPVVMTHKDIISDD